jgi:hypothetical protein
MLLRRVLMRALMSLMRSSLGFTKSSSFSPGRRTSKSLRSARHTPLCASLAGVITGGLNASSSKLPTTELARMSVVFAGFANLVPIAGGGISAPVCNPGSDLRSALSAIFGSVPTALTGVSHA